MSKALLVGYQRKGNVTGISQSFYMVVEGFRQHAIPVTTIYLTQRNAGERIGTFNLFHVLLLLGDIVRVWVAMLGVPNLYITISLSTWGMFKDFLIIIPAHLLRKHVVVHVHSGGYGLLYAQQGRLIQAITRSMFRCVDQILVLGELLKSQFDFDPGLRSKLIVVRNGLPMGLDNQAVQSKRLEEGRPIRLLYLSNMIVSKGYLDLLEACKILKQAGLPFTCDFYGNFVHIVADQGENAYDQDWFLRYTRKNGLDETVRFHGPVTGTEKQAILER
ncbi:MAG: glycosyltransferase family 4 protein, partial [Chloroflexi bacterium]|nr:glycosyltransferase family 4 protein [Chloroflexota bacterium]